MVTEFKFPDVGEGIQEGELISWKVAEGDKVEVDQILAEVETDKAVVELPSPVAGTILKLYVKPGDAITVGQVLVAIGKPDEKVSIEKKQSPEAARRKKKRTGSVVGSLPETLETSYMKPMSTSDEPHDLLTALDTTRIPTSIKALTSLSSTISGEPVRALALPSTRRLARDLGVPLDRVTGTGPNNRVTDEDVRRYAEAHGHTFIASSPSIPSTPFLGGALREDAYGLVESVPLRGIRRATARRMVEAASTAVLVTHTEDADVTELYNLRKAEKLKAAAIGIKLTYLPFIIKAVIIALKKHPALNSSLDEEHDEIHYKRYYNIGVAVDTPNGLIVPVVKNADKLPLYDLAKKINEFVEKATKRTIRLEDLRGGTFTITNVGVYGGIYATPIISPPQSAILATGAIRPKPLVVDDDIRIRQVLPLSLSFDHRIADGAEAARFTNTLKEYLERPARIFIDGGP
ncbi:MAG: dihydrolipoamide acetyltransferase family protein [Candidatus Ranarchaeia archaeon]